MGTWIDFKQLREQLDFGELLRRYGVQLKANSAGQHHGRCPLPGHPKESTSLSFSASLKKRVWRCFSCGRSGNALDFVIYMEGLNPKVAADVRKVALMLQEHAGGNQKPNPKKQAQSHPTPRKAPPGPAATAASVRSASPIPEVINAPLDFALKNLGTDHDYFHKHDIAPKTIAHFGLGYCSKGIFAGRIVVPLHNGAGKLVGYFGVLTDEFEVSEQTPRYLWPQPREHNGIRHVLDRSGLLYHSHLVQSPVTDLLIVQSAESAWRLWQEGFTNVVSILGDAPSIEQSESILQLVPPDGRIHFLMNKNKIGERCAAELFYDLGPYRWCRWVKLEEASSPAESSADELHALLSGIATNSKME